MRKLLKGLEIFIDRIVIAMVFAIFVDVTVGVFFRYILNNPLKFSFDLATLLFAWVTFLGLVSAARKKAHIGIDILFNYLSATKAAAVVIISNLLMIFISLMMVYLGVKITLETEMELAGLEISQKWLYASMPMGFILMFLFLLDDTSTHIQKWSLIRKGDVTNGFESDRSV